MSPIDILVPRVVSRSPASAVEAESRGGVGASRATAPLDEPPPEEIAEARRLRARPRISDIRRQDDDVTSSCDSLSRIARDERRNHSRGRLAPGNAARERLAQALMFPTLTPAQIDEIARAMARFARLRAGTSSSRSATRPCPSSWSRAGRVQIVRPSLSGETRVALHGPGQFTGEANLFLGRRSLTRAQGHRSGRGRRAESRGAAESHPDRSRHQQDPDAGVHLPPHRAVFPRVGRRRPDRFDAFGRNASESGNS